jgi:mRNA-degrading endonuclease RelE of RelBE toxin-antitoxin system
MNFKQINHTDPFKKDLKKLAKRYRTLEDDLKIFICAQLKLFHKIGQDNDGIKQIPGFDTDDPKIFKAKKFACRSLKGKGARSGIRIIYAYFEQEDQIDFLEIYYKGDKTTEDTGRIRNYLSSNRQS